MARDSVRIEGLDDVLRRLKALGPEASKRGGPVRSAVRKAAVVIQKQAQANVQHIVATPNIGGQDYSTGTLRKSVRVMRQKARNDGVKGESYIVTVPRRARYDISPRTPSGIGVATIGKMLEYGTAKRQPMPWMRPAYHAKGGEAVTVMRDELLKGIETLERKLGQGL